MKEMVRIQKEDFSMDEEVKKVMASSKSIGGVATFLGTARDISKGKDIELLSFEHYHGMAEKKLSELRDEMMDSYDIIELSIIHRVGEIKPGENIVLIVAAARHRAAAFDACEACIDELKRVVPIWKKETTTDGDYWVEEHP
ncbi:MAG: molybdenum cofactor biosynthesis protein MoaE [bacterium]|nr:molybdenum cofactor biosynthesis protein MoaE [bacterium]